MAFVRLLHASDVLAAGAYDMETEMAIAPSTERVKAHQSAVTIPLADVAKELSDLLTRDLTAYLTKVSDAGTVSRWATGKVTNVRPAHEQRLRLTYEIVQVLRAYGNSDQTIRAWFLGLNPHLDDDPPVEAIREGQLKEAFAAARAFVAGSY